MPIQCSIKASCKGPKYWIFCVCVCPLHGDACGIHGFPRSALCDSSGDYNNLKGTKWQDWYCSPNLQHSYQGRTIDTLHVDSLQSRCSCLMLPNWSKPRHHSSLQWLHNVKQCLQCIHKMQDCQKQSQAQKLHRSKSQHPIHQESSFSIIATPCKTQILGCSLPFGRHQHQETTGR